MSEPKKFTQGNWYWINYNYRVLYYESGTKSAPHSSTELKKCLAIMDDGINGLFKTDHLDNRWIGISKCQEYVGKMKSPGFIASLFGEKEKIPDIN